MFSTYDSWKTRSPDDEVYSWGDAWGECEYFCDACKDVGWMMGPYCLVIPCTECGQEPTLDDLEEEAENEIRP